MSNCIAFVKHETVHFSGEEIDIPKFAALLQSVRSFSGSARWADLENLTPDQRMAYWFLVANTTLIEPLKSAPAGDWRYAQAMIVFGGGNSGHTWRDFRGTLETLSQFMLTEKHHKFLLTDEFDGHKEVLHAIVDFRQGKVTNEQFINKTGF